MTSEVVAMNRMGVALAADSAASIDAKEPGGTHKIYNSVCKLFMLSRRYPVGIMIYNNASLLGVPWETIIKLFRREHGDTKFDTLEGYGNKLISYLGDNQNHLFPIELQKRYYLLALETEYLSINEKAKQEMVAEILYSMQDTEHEARDKMEYIENAIEHRISFWKELKDADYFNKVVSDSADSDKEVISQKFIKNFSGEINDLINRVFGEWGRGISRESVISLRELAELLISKDYFLPDWFSGVVIAGFGGKEHFPSMQDFKIGGIYENKLKYRLHGYQKITEDNPSVIDAFAYKKMVDNFLYGITLGLRRCLKEAARLIHKMPVEAVGFIDDLSPDQQESWKQVISETSKEISEEFYSLTLQECKGRKDKIVQEIEFLPLKELAQVASTLVSLNSFQQRMSSETETVGGPIDVAVISKGDGFIWIERKHYFQKDLNYHFFQNNFHTSTRGENNNETNPDKQTPNT